MRLAILIPSRNRPRMLSAVITALHEMESGKNEVVYLVGHDADDEITRDAVVSIGLPSVLAIRIMESSTIGYIWNALTKWKDADIYSCLIDDAFPISPHWDIVMTEMVAKGCRAFSWLEVSAPQNIGYPTCTKTWLDQIGYIVPEHYPFWFMDTHFAEMALFVTNQPIPVNQHMALYSKQETTQNLRDLSFWWGFFNATRYIRLREAYKILNGNGSTSFDSFAASRFKWINAGRQRDMEFKGKRIEQLEALKGSKEPPSERYLLAKKRAEEYLETNKLKIWCNL